ncbi:MAG: MoxR family ATPase [Clostridiales bacterium]|nr:MoxR family ATPase [Clostridiales bacterium]
MNIQDAKKEIIRTFYAYTRKNDKGEYCIPTEKQRPILLIGPPGIGKTAIMKQISEETGAGLVAYSMTHHTRQSAIGLPFISEKSFQGKTFSVTEYTMSEIVASLYTYMEETQITEGILFLDEINCVSETLTPVMLQLLQNKIFGTHPLPPGWIIAAAGNPPEYNKSVRELDIVTLDRVKNMEISADLSIWQQYASRHGIHSAIRSYLSVYPDHFYRIENNSHGQQFVTARGWEDLSVILCTYEEMEEIISEDLILQYLQHQEIAHSFFLFYDLFMHFTNQLAKDFPPAQSMTDLPSFHLKMNSSVECLAAASVMFRQIQAMSIAWNQKLRSWQREKELTDLMASQCSEDDSSLNDFFRQKRQALDIRQEHGLLSWEDHFFEENALRSLENRMVSWYKTTADTPRSSWTAFLSEQLSHQQEYLNKEKEDILHLTDKYYELLESSSDSTAGLLFLTSDLAGDDNCSRVLSHGNSMYDKWCVRLLEQTI